MTASEKVQRTLAMIKPDAIDRHNEIIKLIKSEGFTIIDKRRLRLSKEEAEEFYAEHRDKHFFPHLLQFMTSGEVMALILAADDAILKWRRLLGPTNVAKAKEEDPNCLRALYGNVDKDTNAAHGSDSVASANREIKFFFPDLNLEPVLTGEGAKEYLSHAVSPTLVRALTELCEVRPEDPIVWLADWLLANNPNKTISKKSDSTND